MWRSSDWGIGHKLGAELQLTSLLVKRESKKLKCRNYFPSLQGGKSAEPSKSKCRKEKPMNTFMFSVPRHKEEIVKTFLKLLIKHKINIKYDTWRYGYSETIISIYYEEE